MSDAIPRLLRLQDLNLKPTHLRADEKEELARLEGTLDPSLLRRINRFFDRDRKAVVPLRGEICSGCHIKISRSVQVALKQGFATQTCDQCGRVLYLAEAVAVASDADTAAAAGN